MTVIPVSYQTYPETPVCIPVTTAWNASRSDIDGPVYAGQSVLNSFVFDSGPQGTSSHTRGTLLRVDDRIVEIAREVDYKTIFCRRRARGAMATAADHNLE